MGWNVVCEIDENHPKIVSLKLLDDDKTLVVNEECEQIVFCEKISKMMSSLFKKIKYSNIDNIAFQTNFDVKKHITTERIFKSFCFGLHIA